MKIFVKTLKGTHFEIEVNLDEKVADVKKIIEISQGESVYPADQQMLIHKGKVLKDETTLAENNVLEKSFIVIMLRKGSSSGVSTASNTPISQPPTASAAPTPSIPAPTTTPAQIPAPVLTASPTSIDASSPTVTTSDECNQHLVSLAGRRTHFRDKVKLGKTVRANTPPIYYPKPQENF